MDKQCRFSKAEILESGQARARVKWHYACCNINYEVFHGNTEADEYYTVYPDGIAVRKLVAWPGDTNSLGGNPNFWQVLEYILINATGSKPDEVIDKDQAFVLMNEKGDKLVFRWPLPPKDRTPLCQLHPEIKDWRTYIGIVSLKDRPSPFVAFIKDQRFFPYKPCTACGGDHPFFGLFQGNAVWKHWPANPMEDFVLAVDADEDEWGEMPTHTSFLDCNYTSVPADVPPKGCSWLFLIGACEGSDDERLLDHVRSWSTPAKVETGYESRRLSWGCSHGPVLYEGYRYSERAYVLRLAGAERLTFRLTPIVKVINPVFRVENWKGGKPKIHVDGRRTEEDLARWQVDEEVLTVWIRDEYVKPTSFRIE